jgi:hypothetical protein
MISLYVDGFNLYYGLLNLGQRSPFGIRRWIDPALIANGVWPELAPVQRVRYVTAIVSPTPTDPQLPVRKATYLRAMRRQGAEVIFGQLKLRTKTVKLRGGTAAVPALAEGVVISAKAHIAKYDEKGSDVNLAEILRSN